MSLCCYLDNMVILIMIRGMNLGTNLQTKKNISLLINNLKSVMGRSINGTPLKSIVSIVLSLIFTSVFAVGYAVVQRFHVFFVTGLFMGTIITIISITQLVTFTKKVKNVNAIIDGSLNFVSCPAYWSSISQSGNVSCSNNFKNLRFGTRTNTSDPPSSVSDTVTFALNDFNKLPRDEQCNKYPDIAWVERENRCML